MKSLINKIHISLAVLCMFPVFSWAKAVGGADLLLSTDPAMFDKGGTGYVKASPDPWFKNSYVTYNNFELFIFNANKDKIKKRGDGKATDIHLMIAVHAGENGQVSVNGVSYTSFSSSNLPAEYGGGSHGVYDSGDGYFALAPLNFDLAPQEWQSIEIQWNGFSEIHFDAFSANGFYNSPKNDVTAVASLPSTIMLFGAGLVGIIGIGRARKARG